MVSRFRDSSAAGAQEIQQQFDRRIYYRAAHQALAAFSILTDE
jgi:hypothetical protein